MKLLEVMTREHAAINQLFLALNEQPDSPEETFHEFATLVIAHQTAEEEVVFPFFPEEETALELKQELLAEHDHIQRMLQVVLDAGFEDNHWKSQLRIMRELLTFHMNEEDTLLLELIRDNLSQKDDAAAEEFELISEEMLGIAYEMLKDKMLLDADQIVPQAMRFTRRHAKR